ncbi:MAG: hypothetical protein DWI57_02725, partial [Chloroflexi bacterium]
MRQLTGKTHGILERLPHFFHAQEAGELLVQFVDLFGRSLERAETDIYQVLRAHQVETADNVGSRGYTAPSEQRGDLDKIFALYLEAIGGTTQLVKMSPRFTNRSLQTRRLAALLQETGSDFIAQLKTGFRPATRALLERFAVDNGWFQAEEIQPGFALTLLVGRSSTPVPVPQNIATYIRDRLSPATRVLLESYRGDGEMDARLALALAGDLNREILRDPGFYRKNADEFDQHELGQTAWPLLRGIYREFLRQRHVREADPVRREGLLAQLDEAEATDTPPGDDLARLNRTLLERAFPFDARTRPWGLLSRQIPPLAEVRAALVDEFNRLLTGKELFRADWFPELEEAYPALAERHQHDRAWLNRLVLEAAFPTALEKSYTPYQQRLRGLIQVLRQGASTRSGIIALVAANLGIVEDTPAARRQRQRIRIDEFAPVQETTAFAGVQVYSRFRPENPRSQIRMVNPNLLPVTPEIRFALRVPGHYQLTPFTHWSIINRTTGQEAFYDGALHDGDGLALGSGGMQINYAEMAFTGSPIQLPPGESLLEIQALTGLTAGRLDRTLFDATTFVDDSQPDLLVMTRGRFDETVYDNVMFDRSSLDHLTAEQV